MAECTSEAQEFEAFLRSSAFIEGTPQWALQQVKTVSPKVKVHLYKKIVYILCEIAAGFEGKFSESLLAPKNSMSLSQLSLYIVAEWNDLGVVPLPKLSHSVSKGESKPL